MVSFLLMILVSYWFFSDIDFSEPKVIQDVDLSTHLRGAEVICIFVLNYLYLADQFL